MPHAAISSLQRLYQLISKSKYDYERVLMNENEWIFENSEKFWTNKRLGKSEIDLVNIFIEGLTRIIQLEQKLEKGEDIAADIAGVSFHLNFN